jgi:glutathione S-transferase
VEEAMKLYDVVRAPNPRRVRIFMAEKGIDIPRVPVDLAQMENFGSAFTTLNPMRKTPILELDDGTVIAETVAICRYLDAMHPEPPLFGEGALEQALVEMWQRRIELEFLFPVAHAFRHLHPAMREREVPQIPAWGEANKPRALEFLAFLDAHLADRPFVCGERFTIADITGLCAIDWMRPARIEMPDDLSNVRRWHEQLSARPSASA